jgi:hypothetical protein
MNGFFALVLTFAFKAVEIGISYSMARDKEKDLKRANADRDAILSRQAAVLDAEKSRKLRVGARVRTANIASRTATTGGSAESPYRFDNQAVASSLKGAEAFLAETGGISAELRTSASRIRGISNETPGLGSLLLGGIAGIGASAFAAEAEGATSFWGDPLSTPKKSIGTGMEDFTPAEG